MIDQSLEKEVIELLSSKDFLEKSRVVLIKLLAKEIVSGDLTEIQGVYIRTIFDRGKRGLFEKSDHREKLQKFAEDFEYLHEGGTQYVSEKWLSNMKQLLKELLVE